ncbi:MAG: type II toxin-antitoxin system RelE/ParE family toxin [Erythrobacter sp.]|nr:type II toxin-antitoxin system RelE/ParE family toxin [Xanthomonadales bacterium]MDZ4138200.1 type II toxin-antitoxin system RelE/ParE family toxin [Erythrobacter sp.]
MPHAGRRVPEYQIDTLREVLERPYRIIYRIQPDEIEVLTVMHYRQLLPGDLA